MTQACSEAGPENRPHPLLLAAFKQAKSRGKSEWWQMTTPVLKNRMLSIDANALDELLNGRTFRRWIETENSVSVTPQGAHAIVTLSAAGRTLLEEQSGESASAGSEAPDWRRLRLRPDLWRAMRDYDSPVNYVWDEESNEAVRASGPDDARPVFPTMTQEDLDALRVSFAATHTSIDISEWRDSGGRTDFLPMSLQGEWNEAVKREIHSRLTTWFADQGSPQPEILQVTSSRLDKEAAENPLRVLESLASLLTPEELRSTSIPLSFVVRNLRGRL